VEFFQINIKTVPKIPKIAGMKNDEPKYL